MTQQDTQQFLLFAKLINPSQSLLTVYTLCHAHVPSCAFLCCIVYGHGSRFHPCLIVSLSSVSYLLFFLSLSISLYLSNSYCLLSRSFNFLVAGVKSCTYTVTLANCPVLSRCLCVCVCVCVCVCEVMAGKLLDSFCQKCGQTVYEKVKKLRLKVTTKNEILTHQHAECETLFLNMFLQRIFEIYECRYIH